MTDPLLTIEDATREFRVSPKTIRRRLTAGEIAGAYKRPGNRGPEWVMPRESLAAAGFASRRQAAPVELPSAPEDRAAYWERRAADAEAALRTPEGRPGPAPAGRGRSTGWWAVVGCLLVIGLAAGIVALVSSGDGDDGTGAQGATATVAAFLEGETEPGDAVGLVGQQRRDAVPTGRVVAATPSAGWAADGGPRYVVATFEEASPPAAVAELRSSAALLLRLPEAGTMVEVYDRDASSREPAERARGAAGQPSDGADSTDSLDVTSTERPLTPSATDGTAPSTTAPTTSAAPSAEVATPVPADDQTPAAPVVEPTPEGVRGGPTAVPSADAAEQIEVQPGDSFWSIAERAVTAELGSAPLDAVTSYWVDLVAANADRLVEPGNPDLVHVGQMIVLPAGT